jgi:hypothetical protein
MTRLEPTVIDDDFYNLPVHVQVTEGISMAQNRTNYRNILTRGLSAIALFAICGFGVVGTSAVLLGASSTAVLAHGGGGHGGGGFHGGGFHGGGFRHGGFGFGYWGPGYDYPYGYAGYDDETVCYVARRRVMTRHGWRIRPVEICS